MTECLWRVHYTTEHEARAAWRRRPAADRVAVEPGVCARCGRWTVRVPDQLEMAS